MFLLKTNDPLGDFLGIILADNPSLVGKITEANIAFRGLRAQTAAETLETGYNTRAVLSLRGLEVDILGEQYVYWNRVQLSKVFPPSAVRIQTPSRFGYFHPAEMETVISQALGSDFTLAGTHYDYTPGSQVAIVSNGLSYKWNLSIYSSSLRYVPETINFIVESTGEGLGQVISVQGAYPFVSSTGEIFEPLLNSYLQAQPRYAGETRRSYALTLTRMSWEDVLGNDPTEYIIGHPDGGYKFTDNIWRLINLKLSIYGLPPFGENKFSRYSNYSANSGRLSVNLAEPRTSSYALVFENTYTNWDYQDTANLFNEASDGYATSSIGYSISRAVVLPYSYL